jgi:DNA-3-methyladenine glycosylase
VASSSEPAGGRLTAAFFDRPTRAVARDLLGTTLAVRGDGPPRSVRLVEVEAYVRNDPASHAFRGPTPRTRSMFGGPGTLYMFRIHQVACANLTTRPGEAVLLRSGAPIADPEGLPSGPGRLCRYLGLTLADDGTDVTRGTRIALRARPDGVRVPVVRSPRVGISRAVDLPLRYSIVGDPWVSRPRPAATGP